MMLAKMLTLSERQAYLARVKRQLNHADLVESRPLGGDSMSKCGMKLKLTFSFNLSLPHPSHGNTCSLSRR